MKAKLKSLAGTFIPILLGLGLMLYTYNSFTDQQIEKMKIHLVSANYNYVLLSLILAVAGYILRAYRWKYTIAQIGYKPDFTLNFLAVSIGYFVNLSIPRSGEVSRALILKKYQNIPFDKAFGTIIAERIIDFIVLLSFILITVFIEYNTLKGFILSYISIQKLIILLSVGFVGMLIALYMYFYSEWRLILLLKSKIEGLKEGIFSVLKISKKWAFLIYTLLIWMSYILMFYSTTFALKETETVTFGTVLVAFIIGSLVVTFTNGGFGFFPVIIGKLFFLYGIPLAAGNAFGLIVWTSQFIITVFLGILSFLVLPLIRKKQII